LPARFAVAHVDSERLAAAKRRPRVLDRRGLVAVLAVD
jgi:hypothetical protein